MATEQLALLPAALAPVVVPDVGLEALARDLMADAARLPLWAEMAGEAWFARAWAACLRWDAVARVASFAGGRYIMDEGLGDEIHLSCHAVDARGNRCAPPECAACAGRARSYVGEITLAMLREGIARKAGR
jgi:hypothetical protein